MVKNLVKTNRKLKFSSLLLFVFVISLLFVSCSPNKKCCNCIGEGKVTSFGITQQCKYCGGTGTLSSEDFKKKCLHK